MEQAKNRDLVLRQVFFIFILPSLLLGFGMVPFGWRMVLLCIALLFMLGVIRHEGMSDEVLGLGKRAFQRAIIPYSVFTVLGVVILWQLAKILPEYPRVPWWHIPHLLFLFLPVSILQEVAYRGFLFPKMKIIFPEKWLLVFSNALLFTLIHTIYTLPSIMLPLAFISGLAFAMLYMRYPSLWAIALSHAILNFAAIFHGFFYFVR